MLIKERSNTDITKGTRLSQMGFEDSQGYIDGPNLYQLELSDPVDKVDPTGLAAATTQPSQPNLGPNQIGTVTTGPNAGSAVYAGINTSDGTANGTWWINQGGSWQQVQKGQIQSLPREAYQPKPQPATQPTPPTPPVPNLKDQATEDMKLLQLWGNEFSQQDGEWSWHNQCDFQAANLLDYLRNFYFDKLKKPMWDLSTTGGSTSLNLNHNVVLLTPINGNPLPPMTLDSFHGLFPWQNKGRVCTLESLQQFKADYPNPVGTDK